MEYLELIKVCAGHLHNARRICVLTGAGVSQESGVPTFRDALDGLWARYDPQQLATPQAFRRDPKLVWDWYEYRRQRVRAAQPNPGHSALAALQQRFPTLRIITQNVDDLHERAGSTDVIRLHGNIALSKCSAACRGEPTWVDVNALQDAPEQGPPPCPYCGQLVRPDVVWFGENLPRQQLDRAMQLAQSCDLMLVVGTSGVVSPASTLPSLARRAGALLIEVNPFVSEITPLVRYHIVESSGVALPALVTALDSA